MDAETIVRSLAQHCLDEGAARRWREFMEEHAHAFAGCDGEQHELEHTAVHARFCAMVDASLEAHLHTLGHSADSFADICQAAIGGGGGGGGGDGQQQQQQQQQQQLQPLVAAFTEVLSMAAEFACFSDVMRDEQKRDYFFGVLSMWRGALASHPAGGGK